MTYSLQEAYAPPQLRVWREPRSFLFAHEPLFERITTPHAYWPKWRNADIPEAERRPKRVLAPRWLCPFSAQKLEEFRTMEQASPAWLGARNCFLSSSRFGVIAAEHPQEWERCVDFWRESTGRTPPKVFGPVQQGFLDHGKHFEPIARRTYERVTGTPPMREEGLRVDMHPPYIYSASPDGIGARGLIEIKCKAVGPASTEPPYYYLPQIAGAASIYGKEYSDYVGYWARPRLAERFMYCERVYTDPLYWTLLRLRLDYMAWCIVHDRPPTGMLFLKREYPLPTLRTEALFFYEGTAEIDDAVPPLPNFEDPVEVC